MDPVRYKRFPPKWNNIHVPIGNKAAALAAIATYAPCARRAVWGQRAAWALVSVGGTRLLPGRSRLWNPPLPEENWRTLLGEVSEAVGSFDCHTVYERPDGRQGLSTVLLAGDRSIGFLKARADDHGGLIREELALRLVEDSTVRSFAAPRLLGSGVVAGWRYHIAGPMPPRMHRMPKGAPSRAVFEDIKAVLGGLESPPNLPNGWEPCHGDFAPWNFRQIGISKPWLTDWEEAGWGPPGADEVFYGAAAAAVGRPIATTVPNATEAMAFWRNKVEGHNRAKLAGGLELNRFDTRLLNALQPGAGVR